MSDPLPPTSQRVEIDARELGVSLDEPTAGKPERKKASYVGAPAIFALEQACAHINAAFDKYGNAHDAIRVDEVFHRRIAAINLPRTGSVQPESRWQRCGTPHRVNRTHLANRLRSDGGV